MGRLIKHELRESYLEMLVLNGSFLAVSLILGLLATGNYENGLIIRAMSITLITAILLYMVIYVVLIMNIVRTFNNKIFTDQGYLTLTLPISIDKIILSKYIVNIIWTVITVAVGIIGLLIIFAFVTFSSVDSKYILESLMEVAQLLVEHPLTILLYLVGIFTSFVLALTALFFVLTFLNIGKIKKAKTLLGMLSYMGIFWVINIIESIFSRFTLCIARNESGALEFTTLDLSDFLSPAPAFNINSFIISVGAIIGLYLCARHLLKTKLELE